uniref:Uncharacterized protein n=1 Tax=Latimeria chalumnae TaxID=7897 RepID=H2ZVD3_LATCH
SEINTTMAAFMETVSSDLCCSICLDLYTDPVMLDCSHSFCRACISQIMWKTKGNLSCPHCRQVFFHTSLKPNLALANIVESFKAETSEQSRKRQKLEEKDEFYCEKHEEKLKLFCEEDQEMVCLVCAMSESHKSHNLLPIKEAFQIYKTHTHTEVNETFKFGSTAREARTEMTMKKTIFKKSIYEKTSYLKKQMREDFSKLHKFINKEEGDFKNKLERKEMEVLKQLEENGVKTAQQISRVEQSISEIQKRLNSQRQELLKVTRILFLLEFGAWTKSNWNTKQPTLKQGNTQTCPIPIRVKLVTTCRIRSTINPNRTHLNLIVSDQKTHVQWSNKWQKVHDNQEKFIWHSVALISEGFTSGKYYWEIEVGEHSCWCLGVVRGSAVRKKYIEASPANGFYCLNKLLGYWVYCPRWTCLPLTVEARKIRVCLDYEGGQVSFYNADNMSHIYTYTDTFTDKMYPYF